MNIAFRVDASLQTGTGHFVRCLTLADAFKACGAAVRFISRHMPDHSRKMLAASGFEFRALSAPSCDMTATEPTHARWLGTSQSADAKECLSVLSDRDWDWLIIDNYARLDANWESDLRRSAKRLLVIDDLADRQHNCDVILDQNYYADMDVRYAGKVPGHCRLLLGPRYALLRKEFRQSRERVKPRTGRVKRILVFFGGVDSKNHTGQAIEALSKLKLDNLLIDVVIGAEHPKSGELRSKCDMLGFNLHIQTNRMAELMAAADLAVGAGGSATWERCCVGLPALSFSVVENQLQQISDAACAGFLYATDMSGGISQAIDLHLPALLENDHLRTLISRNAFQAVDGRGVSRVLDILNLNKIEIRLARQEDAKQLFDWRNHPTVRATSRKQDLIGWQDHQAWLDAILQSPVRCLLIGHRYGVTVGVVRFDIQDTEAEVSIYLVPGLLGSGEPGLGRSLLLSGEGWLAANRPEIQKVRAHVLGNNERSLRLFAGAGYQAESTSYLKRLHEHD